MVAALAPALAPASRHGVFLQECFVHVVEDVDQSWNGTLVQGQTQAATFARWYRGVGAASPRAVDGQWGSGTGCYGAAHAAALTAAQY